MSRKNDQNGNELEPGAERKFLSPRQLAERWDCSPTTAQRIARNANLAKYCLGEGRNGMVRYLLSEVEAYEEARRVARAL
jgi:hypothetical protein